MNIDRCYCFQQRFADLKAVADDTGADTVAALQEHIEFGKNCRLCHPYVHRMLRTGETCFGEIIRNKEKEAQERQR